MRVRALVAAGLAASLLLPALAAAQSTQPSKKRGKGKKGAAKAAASWLLPDSSSAPSAKDLSKRFADADAVVVLDAVQHEWSVDRQVSTRQQRVRVIGDTGPRLELFFPEGSGPWKTKDGSARVIGASGAARELAAPQASAVDGGVLVSVDASSAVAGELVELVQVFECAHPSYPPWTVQGAWPVLESRYVAVPPPIMTLRAYGFGLPEGGLEPTEVESGDATGAGWRFTEIEALATGPLSPPAEALSPRLLLAVESYPDPESGDLKDMTWPAWGGLSALAAGTWTAPSPVEALAKEIPAEASPEEVLAALREKLRVTRTSSWPENASSKDALERGQGNSADLALVLAGVLRARGHEDVGLVAARPASRGPAVDAAPADGNFTEMLVRVGELWLDPASESSGGALPPRFHGGSHATLGESLTGPAAFPAATSADNRLERKASLSLSAEGRLSGSSTWSFSPFAAALAGSGTTELERPLDRSDWAARDGNTMTYGVLPWRILQDLELSDLPPGGQVDLGHPRTIVDVIAVDLPPGVTGAKLAAPATIDAGPAGLYERSVKPDGRTVTVTRTFRLDVTRFGPDEAERLFTWLRRIQEAERATTKLQLK